MFQRTRLTVALAAPPGVLFPLAVVGVCVAVVGRQVSFLLSEPLQLSMVLGWPEFLWLVATMLGLVAHRP